MRFAMTLCAVLALAACAKKAPQPPVSTDNADRPAFARSMSDDVYQALDDGNVALAQRRPADAKLAFERGLAAGGDPAIFEAQIALALMDMGELDQAGELLARRLEVTPDDTALNWYSAIALFRMGQMRQAAEQFQRTRPLLTPGTPQVWAADWHLGTCYRQLLSTTGITQPEIDTMVSSFTRYLSAQPEAPDRDSVQELLDYVQANRPPENVRRWAVTPDAAGLNDLIENALRRDDED